MKNISFACCVLALFFFVGCSPKVTDSQERPSAAVVESYELQALVEVKDDSSKENVIYHNSPNKQNSIKEVLPQEVETDTDYLGDRVFSYQEHEILREKIYRLAEPEAVDRVSLSEVQWLNDEIVMIHGNLLYNIQSGKTETLNLVSDHVLNYALNGAKNKLACSYLKDEVYVLALYNFKDRTWQRIFERKIDRTYFWKATVMWRNENEILFVTGVEKGSSEKEEVHPGVLDIWRIEINTHESELLIENAKLCGVTGVPIVDNFVYEKITQDQNENLTSTVGLYDLNAKKVLCEAVDDPANAAFWDPEDGFYGYHSNRDHKIKVFADRNGSLLGEIDLKGIYDNEKYLDLSANENRIEIRVFDAKNNAEKHYQVSVVKHLSSGGPGKAG